MAQLSSILFVLSNIIKGSFINNSSAPATLYLSNPRYNDIALTMDNLELVDVKLPTIVIAHGWLEDADRADYFEYMKKSFQHRGDEINYIKVNWTNIAQMDYIISARRGVEWVGYYVGYIFNKLSKKHGLNLGNVQFIGHSLGAHVAGCASKFLRLRNAKLLGRITALDAAGPDFLFRQFFCKLEKHDARMVDALHTNSGQFGYPFSIGTVDFVANGGIVQPGCGLSLGNVLYFLKHMQFSDESYCSHRRSLQLFNESINSNGFVASGAEGRVVFGQNVPANTVGTYYFNTNDKYPFAISKKVNKKQ